MKCMVYGSKYEAILENAVAVPGRVGMAECHGGWGGGGGGGGRG